MHYFVTYGDDRFAKSRERIVREASETGFFHSATFESPETLARDSIFRDAQKNPIFSKDLKARRGGGFWLWKPWVILKNLHSIQTGETLIYSDAGCEMPKENAQDQLAKLIAPLAYTKEDIIGFVNPHIERHYNKADCLGHFGLSAHSSQALTRQVQGGRLVIRKSPKSVYQVERWWSVARDNPELFSNRPSVQPEHETFIAHREDQSVLSLILKKTGFYPWMNWNQIPIKASRIRE